MEDIRVEIRKLIADMERALERITHHENDRRDKSAPGPWRKTRG